MRYDPRKIENKWQARWRKEKIYEPSFDVAPRQARGVKSSRKPFYNLMMFPYPSAEGLHVGNMYAFTGADIYGRFKRMQGYDVFEPIGLDGFGIHSENYAMKVGKHPAEQAKISEKNFYRQLEMLGNGFAWQERLETYDPEYYKWTQWIFAEMFKRGLAYRKKAAVNWCPSCKTVLADEQVLRKSKVKSQKSKVQFKIQNEADDTERIQEEVQVNVCERCETEVVKKDLEQWFFGITKYAERLLKNLEKIDWSEKIKIAQKNWIGKSEGALIKFKIQNAKVKITSQNSKIDYVEIFTTRPDTIFGATFLALSPEYAQKLIAGGLRVSEKVQEYIKKTLARRGEEVKEKTGVDTGIRVINPANGEEIPVWVVNYVLGNVGTGAIMAVPSHDERDFEFAKKYELPIRMVVCPHYPEPTCPVLDEAYTGEGHLVDSGKFTGMKSEEAKWEITKFVGGKTTAQYRLRDWLISRQRYWGPPIPLVFCEHCAERIKNQESRIKGKYSKGELEHPGWIAVPEKDLPVKLPYVKNFRPTGTDRSPLASVEKFYKVRCPKCKSWARRETDVSDTFLDSAWYYLGYLMQNQKSTFESRASGRGKIKNQNDKSKFKKTPWGQEIVKKWLPVDMYIGGAEHAVLHLLYVRFLAMAMKDWGMLHFEEPFKHFRAHGLLIKDGAKMSKSKGNVVNPDDYIRAYGADALRMYLMFLGPFEHGGDFRDSGVRGITRFLERVWILAVEKSKIKNQKLERTLHKTIKKVTEDIEGLQYNTAISALMVLLNEFEENRGAVTKEDIKIFLKLLAPFAPHITEELYQQFFGNPKPETRNPKQIQNPKSKVQKRFQSIHSKGWPKYGPKLVKDETFELVIQVNGKVRGRAMLPIGASESEAKKTALALPQVKQHISAEPRRVIFVPNKLINFVI